MKRIVVTGSKGGAGSSIVAVLRDAGYDAIGIDLLPRTDDDSGYVNLDLRDAAGVNDVFAGADGVVHFGSVPGDSWLSTTEAFHNVAVAGFNVFQAAKSVGIKRVVWASSIEVYGTLQDHPRLPVTEDSPMAPPGIYGGSKVLLESLARDYCRWHGMSIAGFRLSRIIYNRPDGRAKLAEISRTEARGSDCLWAYVDARDVGRACQAWLESDHQGAEVFNVGTDNVHVDTPIRDLLPRHGYGDLEQTESFDEYETPFSSSKLKKMLGWTAEHDWKDLLGDSGQ